MMTKNIEFNNITNKIDEFNQNFKYFENKYSIEKMEYLNKILKIYFDFKTQSPLDILFENNPEFKNNIKFIENQIFQIKYNLMKYDYWHNLSDEVKKFYNDLLQLYILFNNIIHIDKFDIKLFI